MKSHVRLLCVRERTPASRESFVNLILLFRTWHGPRLVHLHQMNWRYPGVYFLSELQFRTRTQSFNKNDLGFNLLGSVALFVCLLQWKASSFNMNSQLKVTQLHQFQVYRFPESPFRDCLKLVIAKRSIINLKKTQDSGKTYSFVCICSKVNNK